MGLVFLGWRIQEKLNGKIYTCAKYDIHTKEYVKQLLQELRKKHPKSKFRLLCAKGSYYK